MFTEDVKDVGKWIIVSYILKWNFDPFLRVLKAW